MKKKKNEMLRLGFEKIINDYTNFIKEFREKSTLLYDLNDLHPIKDDMLKTLEIGLKNLLDEIDGLKNEISTQSNLQEQNLPLFKKYYNKVLQAGTCALLLGKSSDIVIKGLSPFELFSAYHQFLNEGLCNVLNIEEIKEKVENIKELLNKSVTEADSTLKTSPLDTKFNSTNLITTEKERDNIEENNKEFKQLNGSLKNKEAELYISKEKLIKFDLPEEKAIIDRNELKEIINEIKKKNRKKKITVKSLSKYIGTNLSNAYTKGSCISLSSLEKLEKLSDRKINYTLVLGNKSTRRIILEKSNELAELIGFVLISGSLNMYESKNKKNRSYNLYIHFRKRNRNKALIKHIESLIIKLFKIDKTRIIKKLDENNEIVSLVMHSLPIAYELIFYGLEPDNYQLPIWIYERRDYIIHCLKGFFNGYGDFDLTLPEYKDSIYGNFSLIFEKASHFSVQMAKDYKQLCSKLKIETTKIYKRENSKYDSTIRVIVRINKKDSYVRFLNIVNPLLWNIKRESVFEYYEKVGIDPDIIFSYNEDFLLQQEYNYSRELAEQLLILFEDSGNYDDVTESFNKNIAEGTKRALGKDRIINYIKMLFKEKDYVKCYGKKGYDTWYNNNSRILIGDNLEATTIPNYLNIQIFRIIYQVLSNNLFELDESVVISSVTKYFINKKMLKNAKIEEPNLLEYGRFSRLLQSEYRKTLFEPYFNYVIKFITEINNCTKNERRIGYLELAKRYDVLFYHNQHVKEIIEDLKAEFSEEFKVGFDQDYRWHRLRFKYHYDNFIKINKVILYKKLNKLFDKIAKMNYDVDIFRLQNPRCSDFLISGSRSNPIQSKLLLPYIKKFHNKGIIQKNDETEIGKRLINYVNSAEYFYKKKYPENLHSYFLSDEGNIYHDRLQNFIFRTDPDIIATELLVWIKINLLELDINYLSGHIDFLFFFNDSLYVCDYKPEYRDRIFLKSIPQISSYGLILDLMLKIKNLNIRCITFNKNNAWEYEPSILYEHIPHVVRELKADYPIDAKWETYLKQYFDFF